MVIAFQESEKLLAVRREVEALSVDLAFLQSKNIPNETLIQTGRHWDRQRPTFNNLDANIRWTFSKSLLPSPTPTPNPAT